MNAPSVDIKDMLVADTNLGLVFGQNLFISREPSLPNDCVTIYDTPGNPDGLTMNRVERYEYPTIQVRVRNTGFVQGWAVLRKIRTSLHGRANETWGGAYYTILRVSSGPALLEYDQNNRVILIMNFEIQRR